MIKSINFKLWLVFFVALVFSLGAMLVLTQLSAKNRFLEYATSQILDRLEPLEKAVIEQYKTDTTLNEFKSNPQQWIKLRDTTYRQYLRLQKSKSPFNGAITNNRWATNQEISKRIESNQRVFFHHLTLHNTEGQLIAGQMLEDFKYIKKAVHVDATLIGYIGYIKPKAFLNASDQVFIDQQRQAFVIICIAMIITSLFIAVFLSKWLISPIIALSKNAKRVAAGDFKIRTTVDRDDELGELCDNFNDMAQSLEKNEAARKQWVADISHELRTPLAVLKAQIEAMQDGIRPASPENMSLLSKNVDALNHLVDDLYELSLSDMGALTFDKSMVDIVSLVQHNVKSFSTRAEEEGKSLIFENQLPSPSYQLKIDEKRFNQLIYNLLENSFRYTDSPGKILIEIKQLPSHLVIVISDSKPGIQEDNLPKIFDRLYRVESSRNRDNGGAGLGLSICKSIVEAHQGEIIADHSPYGGLTVTIKLPI